MSPLMRLALRLAVLLTALSPLLAAADPPARVGRLSLIEGHVTFRTDRQDAGAPATSNWPVSSGAILDTDRDGRAEVWIGSNTFRLNGNSRVEFTEVDDQHVALQVGQGTVAVTVRDREQATAIDIGTPAGQVRFGAPGRYRIDIDESNGDTKVASRDGEAYIYRPGGELSVSSGQRAVAYASGGWFVTELRPDAFDDWADARDSRSHASTARRYVSPYMTGYEDLDRYGNWSSSPDYGQVWYPSAVPAGWAPYRYGRWAWISPWGWTWIDEAPWGFAPFHYGRWVFLGGQWAWVPGAYTPRPVYAPALVAWMGNPGWSVSFSFGSSPAVGWFPLAPHEVFVPAYRCSPTYIRQVNVTNVTNVTVIDRVVAGRQQPVFMNRSLPQAVTVVPAKIVQSGSLIGAGELRRPERHELAQAPVSPRAPGTTWLAPTASALRPHQEAISPQRLVSPSDPASTKGSIPRAPTPMLQSAPTAVIQSPAPAPRQSGEVPTPVRRFDPPHERVPQQPTPMTATPAATPEVHPRRWESESQTPSRAVIQPPVQQAHPATAAPTTAVVPRSSNEVPRAEAPAPRREFHPAVRPEFEHPAFEKHAAPPAAVQVQPPSPPHQVAPAIPAAKAPVVHEAAPHPMPAPAIPAARQAPPHDPRQEGHENRREHGKAIVNPQ